MSPKNISYRLRFRILLKFDYPDRYKVIDFTPEYFHRVYRKLTSFHWPWICFKKCFKNVILWIIKFSKSLILGQLYTRRKLQFQMHLRICLSVDNFSYQTQTIHLLTGGPQEYICLIFARKITERTCTVNKHWI